MRCEFPFKLIVRNYLISTVDHAGKLEYTDEKLTFLKGASCHLSKGLIRQI